MRYLFVVMVSVLAVGLLPVKGVQAKTDWEAFQRKPMAEKIRIINELTPTERKRHFRELKRYLEELPPNDREHVKMILRMYESVMTPEEKADLLHSGR